MRRRTSREPDAVEALTLLGSAGATLATAESLTGGRLAAVVTAVPGASVSYLGGFVTYATALKESLLGVPPGLVDRYGGVGGVCRRWPQVPRRDVRPGHDRRRRTESQEGSQSAPCSSVAGPEAVWR